MNRDLNEDEVNGYYPKPQQCGKIPRRLVKRARFQNEVVAEDFAEACRREGFKAFAARIFAKDWRKVSGYEVRWAPTWEHFIYE